MFLNENLNLVRSMTESQIRIASELIFESYYMLSIEDINLCFRRALKGDYGKVYEGLDIMKIMDWLESYFSERCDIAENESIKTHTRFKADYLEIEAIHKYYDKLREERDIPIKYKRPQIAVPKIEYQPETNKFIIYVEKALTRGDIKYLVDHYKKRKNFSYSLGLVELYNYFEKCYYYVKLRYENH